MCVERGPFVNQPADRRALALVQVCGLLHLCRESAAPSSENTIIIDRPRRQIVQDEDERVNIIDILIWNDVECIFGVIEVRFRMLLLFEVARAQACVF